MEHLAEVVVDIVEKVERSNFIKFDPLEVGEILHHTIRKAIDNGKGEDYIPVLFENELRDFLMRKEINARGVHPVCVAV